MPIKNIIFDMGNVLLDLDLERSGAQFQKLLGQDYDIIRKAISGSEVFEQFETGRITEPAFFEALLEQAPGGTDVSALIAAWNSMLAGIPAHRIRMLEELRDSYLLYLISNTNITHMKWLDGHLMEEHQSSLNDFLQLFDKHYFSYQVNLRKPDAEIYQHLIDDAGLLPEETVFIDDHPDNIAGAKEMGIKSILHDPGTEIADHILEKLNG